MMPSKWNLARFIAEDESEVKKALRSEEFEKVIFHEMIHYLLDFENLRPSP